MKARLLWSNVLVSVGLIAMLIGAIDPLEGSLIILPGSGMVALGAFLGNRQHRKLLGWSFVLVAIGIGSLWGLSAIGGLGGSTGRSMWWAIVFLPYPVGWVMGLVGTIGKGPLPQAHILRIRNDGGWYRCLGGGEVCRRFRRQRGALDAVGTRSLH